MAWIDNFKELERSILPNMHVLGNLLFTKKCKITSHSSSYALTLIYPVKTSGGGANIAAHGLIQSIMQGGILASTSTPPPAQTTPATATWTPAAPSLQQQSNDLKSIIYMSLIHEQSCLT